MTETQKRIRNHRLKSDVKSVIKYTVIILAAIIMLYPLIWIIGASFDRSAIPSFSFIPQDFSLIGWQAAFSAPGWGSAQGYSLLRALSNTLQYTIPYVLFGTFSCLITAYVITRMHFKGKKIVFALIIGTLLMPATIFRIPLYAFWTSPGIVNLWDGSRLAFTAYLPLWAGSLFAVNSFSIFMFIQFFRTIPRDLDEAAYMDGANKFQVLFYVLMPILKPIVITVGLLMFISQFNDFQGPLIYRGHVSTYPLPIVLQLLGLDSTNTYAHVFARSIVSVSVLILIFFGAQKYFVGNDADSAIKG
ncbi:carbohydrate ABC transporter permease [Peloplasma aerotolerans]|jgi:oligogalacturonide transport system permease protein|uniref:Carbohydrate ABC transporter permease n=1 Tax=Peloplasma aerotolerans TaxID=3044389 RepID=A0AAW6U863_9MOLU|nr:carbohydrate ABC transporter permease [Mariniplasma sp. M4Ah]MDI6453130.1 carbohydrate ABC transporter permease [Mariniplasma sp. M4Ah]MDR4968545.1 carbohydrate ABC transporter permease [Acholeplasmataceae bacterium]